MNLVWKDAHAQLGAAVGEREEASLQANWQQHEWQVTRTKGLRKCARTGAGDCKAAFEKVSAHGIGFVASGGADELGRMNGDPDRQSARYGRHVRRVLAPSVSVKRHTCGRLSADS